SLELHFAMMAFCSDAICTTRHRSRGASLMLPAKSPMDHMTNAALAVNMHAVLRAVPQWRSLFCLSSSIG
ncbi:hypothetical protein, partial [Pseudomonas protegens]|uniref:hypothetical protein n=1 Tax=Pseudomonas protegens TaxID=380021 RepID=UPI001B3403CE